MLRSADWAKHCRRMIVDDSHLRRPLKQCLTQNSPHVSIRPVDAAGAILPYLSLFRAWFRNTQNSSCSKSHINGWKRSYISLEHSIWRLTSASCNFRLLPSSRAAITVMLLAGPMPLNESNPALPISPKELRLLSQLTGNAPHKSYGAFIGISGTYQNGKQLGVAQRLALLFHHFLHLDGLLSPTDW